MATSIIPTIPLYTIHYPQPLYAAPANAPATASAAATADTDLSELLNLTADNAQTSVGSLIDFTA